MTNARSISFTNIFPSHNVDESRICGECNACCLLLEIKTDILQKPADILCKHSSKQDGCKIYKKRPAVCKTWYCAWREISELPEECRPDKLGIVFTLEADPKHPDPSCRLYVLGRAITDEETYKKPLAKSAFNMFIRQLPLWLVSHGQRVEYGSLAKGINPYFL